MDDHCLKMQEKMCSSLCSTNSPNESATEQYPISFCAGCSKPIKDRYFLKIDQSAWHEGCVHCCVCKQVLVGQCYVRQGKIYCHQHYTRLKLCKRCCQPIAANSKVFPGPVHVECFSCELCSRLMKPGEQYCRRDENGGLVTCLSCNFVASMSQSTYVTKQTEAGSSTMSDAENSCNVLVARYRNGELPETQGLGDMNLPLFIHGSVEDDRRTNQGVKRPRTILTTAQRRKFKSAFQVSQKPTRKARETLANETGLSPRVVQVWFQNQRAKIKKLARKQESLGDKGLPKTSNTDSDNETMSLYSSQSLPTTPHLNATDTNYMSPNTTNEEFCRNNAMDDDKQIDIFNSMNNSRIDIRSYEFVAPTVNESTLLKFPSFELDEDINKMTCSNAISSSKLYQSNPSNDCKISYFTSSFSQNFNKELCYSQAPSENKPSYSNQIDFSNHVDSVVSLSKSCEVTTASNEESKCSKSSYENNPMDKLLFMQNNYFSSS